MASAAVSDEGALRMRATPCGCTSALFSSIHRTASFTVTPQLCLRRPTFSVAPEKVGKKRRRRRVILRAHARDFLAALRLKRPIRAQKCSFTYSLWFRRMYYTHLRADCINFASAHFRNTRLVTILHYRRIRRCVLNCMAVCFVIFLRGNYHRWERCHHAGGAVV